MFPASGSAQQARVEAFSRKHRLGLLTVLFTDIVGSTQLKQDLGDDAAVRLIQRHHAVVRELLAGYAQAEEIETAGDSFLLLFAKPSEAVKFALRVQARLSQVTHGHHMPCASHRLGLDLSRVGRSGANARGVGPGD